MSKINGVSFNNNSTLDSFLSNDRGVKTKSNKIEDRKSKFKSNDFFPIQAFTVKGAKVDELPNGAWYVDFINGRYTSSTINESYIKHILAQGDSELIDQGVPQWTVEQIKNGKFIIKRVNI